MSNRIKIIQMNYNAIFVDEIIRTWEPLIKLAKDGSEHCQPFKLDHVELFGLDHTYNGSLIDMVMKNDKYDKDIASQLNRDLSEELMKAGMLREYGKNDELNKHFIKRSQKIINKSWIARELADFSEDANLSPFSEMNNIADRFRYFIEDNELQIRKLVGNIAPVHDKFMLISPKNFMLSYVYEMIVDPSSIDYRNNKNRELIPPDGVFEAEIELFGKPVEISGIVIGTY